MSFPRLAILALALPLLTGGCAGAAAVTAASYGADGVSFFESGKTTTDHFMSMVSKKDCAMWRVFANRRVCRERDSDRDPYHVDYVDPERQPSEDGVAYTPPLRPQPGAPASSWTAEAYKPASAPAVVAEPVVAPPEPSPAPPIADAKPVKPKAKAPVKAAAKPVRKPSPGQVASVP